MVFTNGDRGASSRGGATADSEALFFTKPGVDVPERCRTMTMSAITD